MASLRRLAVATKHVRPPTVETAFPGSPLVRMRSPFARAERRRLLQVVVAAAVIAGAVLRVAVYRSSIGRLEGDEATWGLMAMHASHGQFTAFFWAQPYGGTQEVLVVGALFRLFGVHLWLMRLVPIALLALSAFVVWRIGKRTIGELPAVAAALLIWVWPPFLIWKLEIWHGFYGSGVLYTAVILLLALRLDESPSKGGVAVFGLVLGLAFWQTLQIVVIAVPAVLWLIVRRPRLWRLAPVAVPGIVLGALPWLLSNLHHHWWSLNHEPSQAFSYAGKLRVFADATLPLMLGLRVPITNAWAFTAAGSLAIYGVLVVAFAVVAWRRRHTQLSLLVTVLVMYPFVASISGQTSLANDPRYVVLAVPAIVLLVAAAAVTVPRLSVLLVVAVAVSALVLARWVSWDHGTARADPQRMAIGPVIAALEHAGIDRAFAGYWLAYRITFTTRERVIVSEVDLTNLRVVGPHRVMAPVPTNFTMHHHPAYDTAVRTAPRYAYLIARGDLDERRDLKLLRTHGYREQKIGPISMFVSPSA